MPKESPEIKRIHVQVGPLRSSNVSDSEGLFEVTLDIGRLQRVLARAAKNKSRRSCIGPLVATYHPLPRERAEAFQLLLIASDRKDAVH